jgi:hypothetical protein
MRKKTIAAAAATARPRAYLVAHPGALFCYPSLSDDDTATVAQKISSRYYNICVDLHIVLHQLIQMKLPF